MSMDGKNHYNTVKVVKTTTVQPLPRHSGPALRGGPRGSGQQSSGKPGAEEWTLQQRLEDLGTGPGFAVNA